MFENNQIIQEMDLIPRHENGTGWMFFLLFVCIALIALARIVQHSILLISIQNTFFFETQDDQLGKGVRPNSLSRLLMMFQFITISILIVNWLLVHNNVNHFHPLVALIPAGYLLYQLITSVVAGSLTGQQKIAREEIYFTLALYSVMGILLLIEFFVFYFQTGTNKTAMSIVGFTYALFLVFRIIRSVFLGLSSKVSWYYIILYFWTLEILPILIVTKLLLDNGVSGITE